MDEVLRRYGYRKIAWEGSGAFAKVYKARRCSDGQVLACKAAEGAQAGALLAREAMLLKQLSHPLFPRYEDCVEEDGRVLLMMEFVEGVDLDKLLERGALEQRRATRIAAQLAEGLLALHEMSGTILYRDLKPENIRITPGDKVRLLDLGCACSVDEARYSRAGSRGYAAPEQLEEKAENGWTRCGPYSDVYALGKLLHYMLTGENPCLPPRHKQPIRTYDRSLSPLLEQFVQRCTAEDPQERLPDMRRVLRMLAPFCRKTGKERILREQIARIEWFLAGRKWRVPYTCQKNICKIPGDPELFSTKGVL